MKQSMRDNLAELDLQILSNEATHAGLWFDKYLAKQPEKKAKDSLEPYQELIAQCQEIGEPDGYKAVYEAWRTRCKTIKAKFGEVTINGRLAIGLGNASTIKTGATFHHTYGVPIIPGSALKGTTAAYARRYLDEETWGQASPHYKTLFGTPDSAGYITFFDALPIPRKLGGNWSLEPDVITVHHPDYYQGQTNAAPADWDSPTPIPFLSVTGKFLVVLYAPDAPAWTATAYGILQMALAEIGVGGKTSSGYGRIQSRTKSAKTVRKAIPSGFRRGVVKGEAQGPNKSYWYIIPDEGGKDIFVHKNDLSAGLARLKKGQQVLYKIEYKQGRPQAVEVQLA